MKERLIEIINILKQVAKETSLNVSDDKLLEQSATYHRGELAQENRSNYKKEIVEKPSDEITPKQKAFLIKIKKYKEGMTKQTAFTIISNLKKNQKDKEY